MQRVTVKLPKRKRAIKILDKFPALTPQLVNETDDDYTLIDFDIDKENDENETSEIQEDKKPTPTVFVERFVISDSNQPIRISLENLPEDTLTISQAQLEIQTAYDSGFNDGQDSIRSVYETEMSESLQLVRNIDLVVKELRKNYRKQILDFNKNVTDIAVTIAESILEAEITQNPDIVINQVKKAIASLDEDIVFKILVAPQDLETIVQVKSRLVSDESMLEDVIIAADKKLQPGSCILHTSAGTIDAQISEQLLKIRKSLSNLSHQSDYEKEISMDSSIPQEIDIPQDIDVPQDIDNLQTDLPDDEEVEK
jgi:flagellar biosynthesis/type III secretory pathway protein FliH